MKGFDWLNNQNLCCHLKRKLTVKEQINGWPRKAGVDKVTLDKDEPN